MAIKSSGTFLRFSEIAAEFNDSQPHSMSEFTRGGILVPDSASNSLIRSVAQRAAGGANGRMKWSDYYGAANAFGLTIASTVTDLDLATLFNTAQSGIWASSDAKILTINSGVIIGATSTGNAALTIPSGMGGTLVIVNNGAIQGAGGAANGGAGGNAISVLSSGVTLTNNGDIYAGGGGGGKGGTGGQGAAGSVTTSNTVYGSSYTAGLYDYLTYNLPLTDTAMCNHSCAMFWYSGYYCVSGCTISYSGSSKQWTCSGSCGYTTTTATTGGSGGAGGNGGVGQGYLQSNTSGSGGAGGYSGGTNAGTGGTGGTGGNGGAFGVAGNTGTTGYIGGNNTSGTAGAAGAAGLAGGAAGKYISGISNVTFTNNGNTAGTTS